jgi:hypothetical protein
MTGMVVLSAFRYCGNACSFTAVMVLINVMTEPELVPLANGLAQSSISFARFIGTLPFPSSRLSSAHVLTSATLGRSHSRWFCFRCLDFRTYPSTCNGLLLHRRMPRPLSCSLHHSLTFLTSYRPSAPSPSSFPGGFARVLSASPFLLGPRQLYFPDSL